MEKLYDKLNNAGVCNLVLGIVVLAIGAGAGVMMIINGASLLKSKKDITF